VEEQRTQSCRFCISPIHPDAIICPACLSPQKKSSFESARDILKWIGGIAAVVSLIIGVTKVSNLVQSWSERRQAVEELVEASYLRETTADFQAAWGLMEDALKLDPSSALARKKQVFLAMKWLRSIGFRSLDDKEAKLVGNLLLPVLYRGAVSKDNTFSADILAHIGLAGYIERKELRIYRINPLTHYKLALEKDSANVYGHTLMGKWIIYTQKQKECEQETLDKALHHFSAAMATKKEHDYVQKAQFASLRSCGIPGKTIALKEANSMRLKKAPLALDIRLSLIKLYRPLYYMGDPSGRSKKEIDSLLAALSPRDLMDTYMWLNQGVDYENTYPSGYRKSDHRVIMIRLEKNLEKSSSS